MCLFCGIDDETQTHRNTHLAALPTFTPPQPGAEPTIDPALVQWFGQPDIAAAVAEAERIIQGR